MLQRRFFSHWIWEENRSFSKAEAFLDLLQLAAFAPTKRVISGALIELDEGEIVASVRYLSARWTWGKDKVAGFMKLLESDGMIRRETRHGETVIILSNYKDYNRKEDDPPDRAPDAKPDRGQTVTRQWPDKVEEEKKDQEGGEANAPARPRISDFDDEMPTTTAKEFDRIQHEINRMSPRWRTAFTRAELETLHANRRIFFDFTNDDWNLLAAYMHASIPEYLGKFYQPNNRGRFMEHISDIISHADNWKSACRKHRIPTGLETNGHAHPVAASSPSTKP